MQTFEIDQLLFDDAQTWLEFAPDGPAVLLTPLDWTDYETARRLSLSPGTNVVDIKTMFKHLVRLSKPVDWKGFERSGQALSFDRDLFLKLLCSNMQLGLVFDKRLQEWAANQRAREETEIKNSAAGSSTPSYKPGKKKAEKAEA